MARRFQLPPGYAYACFDLPDSKWIIELGYGIMNSGVIQMRSVVLIHGELKGMGQRAGCAMLAIRENGGSAEEPEYSRYSVIDAPAAMPDGQYTVKFGERLIFVLRSYGLWLPDVEL